LQNSSAFQAILRGIHEIRFRRIVKTGTFLSPNGLFQSENAPKCGQLGLHPNPAGELTIVPQTALLAGKWTPLPIPLLSAPRTEASFSFSKVGLSGIVESLAQRGCV